MEPKTIYYYDGTINKVDDSTKSAVKKAYNKIRQSLQRDFTDRLVINVTSDFSNLPPNASLMNNYLKENESQFSYTRGITTDDISNREIFIQESAFWPTKLSNIFSLQFSFSADKEIEQATMHELGHSFDYFYGGNKALQKKHQELIKKYDKKQFQEVKCTPEEERFMKEYLKNNGFSDKQDFKNALVKDLKNIKLNMEIKTKFGYFLAEFYNRGTDIIPNSKDVEEADSTRAEVFAQLFSYAMGTDDGNADEFIKLLPNTYKIVQKYINTHRL